MKIIILFSLFALTNSWTQNASPQIPPLMDDVIQESPENAPPRGLEAIIESRGVRREIEDALNQGGGQQVPQVQNVNLEQPQNEQDASQEEIEGLINEHEDVTKDKWDGQVNFVDAPLKDVLRWLAKHSNYNYFEPPDPQGILESTLITATMRDVTPQLAFEAVARMRGFKIETAGGITTLLRPDMTTPQFLYTKMYPLRNLEVLWVLQEVANLVGIELTQPSNTLASYPEPSAQYGSSGGSGSNFSSNQGGGGSSANTGGGVPDEPRWLPSLPFDSPLHTGGFSGDNDGSGDSSIFADRRKNAIVLRGTEFEHLTVRRYIEEIDVPEAQILIETRIVEVSDTRDLDQGFDFSSALLDPGLAFGIRTLDVPDSPLLETGEFLFYPGGAILDWPSAEVVFRNFARKGIFKSLANPQVITRSGVPVSIRSTRSEYVQQFTASGNNQVDSSNNFTTGFQTFETGVTIDIVPRLLENDYIEMNVNPVVAQEVGRSAENLPIIDTRSAQTTVRVKSTDTIVIGGLTRATSSKSTTGVPPFDKIPFLGDLVFGNKRNDDRTSNLIIFVTPRKIEANQNAYINNASREVGFVDDVKSRTPSIDIRSIDLTPSSMEMLPPVRIMKAEPVN